MKALAFVAAGLFALLPQLRAQAEPFEVESRFERVIIVKTPRNSRVDQTLYQTIRDEIERAVTIGERTALVLDIDSGGGLVSSAQNIAALLRKYSEHEDVQVFAFVPRSALSAAAWIAMSCQGLLIHPDAEIGNIQLLIEQYKGYERVTGKVVTSLAEALWTDVRHNGYPRLFVEAMVDPEMSVVEVKNRTLGTVSWMRSEDFASLSEEQKWGLEPKTITSKRMALTTNGEDMMRFGFSVALIRDHAGVARFLGTKDAEVEIRKIERRGIAGLEFDWSWLLVATGFLFLVLEMKTPGIGAFGLLGLLSFGGFFLMQSGLSDVTLAAVVLLVIGVFLVIVEMVILPGFGVAGISGVILIFGSTYLSAVGEFRLPDFGDDIEVRNLKIWAVSVLGCLLLGFSISLTVSRYLHLIPFVGKLIQRAPRRPPSNPDGVAATTSAVSAIGTVTVAVGDRGVAITTLRPAGVARLGGQRVDVVAEAAWIDADAAVVVTEVAGNRVVVRQRPAEETP